jgi:hypothetical protein
MIENYFVMLVTHLKYLAGNIADMTRAIFKIETNVKKIYFFSNANVLSRPSKSERFYFIV